MEDKKQIKISLKTFLIVLTLIIFAIVGLIFYFYNASINYRQEIAEVTDLDVSKEEVTNDVEEENTNFTENNLVEKIEDHDEENEEKIEDHIEHLSKETKANFSKTEIKKAVQNYLDMQGALIGSTEGLLVKLKLTDYDKASKYELTEDNYKKTDIKFEDFKNEMLKYMTENWFNIRFVEFDDMKNFKDVNGMLYYLDVGATGIEYEVKDFTLKGDYSPNRYVGEVYVLLDIDGKKEVEDMEFFIKDVNGKCLIDFYL